MSAFCNIKKATVSILFLLFSVQLPSSAQSDEIKENTIHERSCFELKHRPVDLQLLRFRAIYQSSEGNAYNLKNFLVSDYPVGKIKINPTGHSFATLSSGGKSITILSNKVKDEVIAKIRSEKRVNPFDGKFNTPRFTSFVYTSDAEELFVATEHAEVIVYSTKLYNRASSISTGKVYDNIAVSPNKYYLAGASGNDIDIWSLQSSEIKRIIHLSGPVNHLAFSPDSKILAVCGDSFGLHTINVLSNEHKTITGDIRVVASSFHPEGKYIAYGSRDSLYVYNLINEKVVFKTGTACGSPIANMLNVDFYWNQSSDQTTLSHNTASSIVFWDMSSLPPLYKSRLSEEVEKMMYDWARQMDGESMEEYKVRVTDEKAVRQKNMLLDQAATAIAVQTIVLEDPFISETYDMENHSIDITFNDLKPVKLEMPEEEARELKSSDLLFENPIYTIDENDEFQLVYLEVTNQATEKRYIFDARKYVMDDVDFADEEDTQMISVAMLQTVNMEMEALQEQTRQIMEEKKHQKVITDKTTININTEIVHDYDADGKQIYNYKLNCRYDVQEGFSLREDFGPGKYEVGESHAAVTVLESIRTALEGEMKKYVQEADAIEITVTGTADATPIVSKIIYNGKYGEYNNQPYMSMEGLSNMTIDRKTNITTNEQLAFIRAAGVKCWLENEVDILKSNSEKCLFRYKTEVSRDRGSEFRRIVVEIAFKNVFKD